MHAQKTGVNSGAPEGYSSSCSTKHVISTGHRWDFFRGKKCIQIQLKFKKKKKIGTLVPLVWDFI
jgi:hypothetical protein